MINIRQAEESDVSRIRGVYTAVYGTDYPYRDVYNEKFLKRWIFNDEVLSFVAEDSDSKEILGTASVQCDFGAHS
ncbi:MAG TPA: hypothetical protein VLB09_09275, partial [Nitrospiria bacterium]|nr:hypothetical protein [Nitrospiria bacterium]